MFVFLYGKHICNCRWELIGQFENNPTILDKIAAENEENYLSFQVLDNEMEL